MALENTLDAAAALEIATGFKLVPGFPWDAVDATAKDLMRWCNGAIVNGRVWPPEAQAREVAREARESWEKWMGTAQLKAIFDAKFRRHIPLPNGFQDFGPKPPIDCTSCKDTGYVRVRGKYQYCDCALAERMKGDAGDNAIHWLHRMDVSFSRSHAEPPRPAPLPNRDALEAEYFANHPKEDDDA